MCIHPLAVLEGLNLAEHVVAAKNPLRDYKRQFLFSDGKAYSEALFKHLPLVTSLHYRNIKQLAI